MTESREESLDSLAAKGRALLSDLHQPARAQCEFEAWDVRVAKWLDAHHPDTGFSAEWSSLSVPLMSLGRRTYDDDTSWITFQKAVRERLGWLARFGLARIRAATDSADGGRQPPNLSHRIFIVHGHSEAIREATARFISKLKLEPVILHEQPNKGRTIIEKIVDYADVGFAVVLLTGDDKGATKESPNDSLRLRARQNVILELGFFIGHLGRERVAAIYEPGVELPSDYDGVLWIECDGAGAWKLQLAREIKASGIVIDMNDAV